MNATYTERKWNSKQSKKARILTHFAVSRANLGDVTWKQNEREPNYIWVKKGKTIVWVFGFVKIMSTFCMVWACFMNFKYFRSFLNFEQKQETRN